MTRQVGAAGATIHAREGLLGKAEVRGICFQGFNQTSGIAGA